MTTPWVAYYENGDEYSSVDYHPWEIPPLGIVGIAQDTRGQYENVLFGGKPWYVFRDDRGYWSEHDDAGFWDQMLTFARFVTAVRHGRYMRLDIFRDERWKKACQQVEAWTHG